MARGAGSTGSSVSSTKSDSQIFSGNAKNLNLTENEIKLLKYLGIDPTDEVAVKQWRSMPVEQKEAQLRQYEASLTGGGSQTPAETETTAPTAPAEATETAAPVQEQPAETTANTPVETPAQQPAEETPVQAQAASVEAPSQEETAEEKVENQPQAPAAANEETEADNAKTPKFDPNAPMSAKPVSLSDMVKPSLDEAANTPIKIQQDKLTLLQASMTDEKWKTYTQEQRLEIVKDALGDKFSEDFARLSAEKKEELIVGMIDNAIKESRGISDEKWDKYSDEKKEELRLKYGTSFALSITKGYSKEDLENLSDYDKVVAALEAYDSMQNLVLSLADMQGKRDEVITEATQNKKFQKLEGTVSQIRTTVLQAEQAANIASAYRAEQAAKNAATFSFAENFAQQKGIELSELNADNPELMAELTSYVENQLKGKSDEEVQALLKKEILSNNDDTSKLLLASLAELDTKNGTKYLDAYSKTLESFDVNELANSRMEVSVQQAELRQNRTPAVKSFHDQFVEKYGEFSLKDRASVNKFNAFVKEQLKGKSPEEIQALLKQEILSSDKNCSTALQIALKSIDKENKTKYYDTYTDAINDLSDKDKMAKLSNLEQQKIVIAAHVFVDNIDKYNDNEKNITKIGVTVANLGDANLAEKHLQKLEGAGENKDFSDVIEIYGKNSKNFDRKLNGVGKTVSSWKNDQARNNGTASLSKYVGNFGAQELTDAFTGANGRAALEQQEAAYNANPKSFTVHKAVAAATPYIAKDTQVEFVQNGWNATKLLDEKGQIEVQKTYVDVIPEVHKDNQLDLFKITMTSEHDEVLEYSSSNIHKLDSSVQADAIKASYDTGNQKAIEACNSQMESCSQEAVTKAESLIGKEKIDVLRARTEEQTVKAAVMEYAKSVIDNNKINDNLVEPEEIKTFTDAEKREYYVNYFMKATDSGRYNMLSKLSDSQLKYVISKLCKSNSSMIKGLVQQGLGKYVLQTVGKSPDVMYSTVTIMLQKGGKDGKYAAEYILSNKSLVHFSDDMLEKAEDIMGKNNYKVQIANEKETEAQLNGETAQYISNPYGFTKNALYPPMSDIYPNKKEMFYNA